MIYKVFTDGGARGNPGPAAAAWIVFSETGKPVAQEGSYLGRETNNIAEYRAVELALRYFCDRPEGEGELELDFFLDSLLVVSQLSGNWKVKEPALKERLGVIRGIIAQMSGKFSRFAVHFTHIPREENTQADALVNRTLDQNSLVTRD